ncbi:uracil permease [Ruminococcaceae bacterium YRB3002]|nr:uracil permease [Ruminococcaceae bacterium YRB3002]
MKLVYDVNDKPEFNKTIVFAFQQMIAIMAATLLVPMLVTSYGLEADPAAALFGAGCGTLVYIFFTKKKSPVFLGSSFTFLGAYFASIGLNFGYLGILIGVFFAGLVYVVIGLIVKAAGSGWVNKLMPAVIIGPIVTLIGLSLSGTATGWMTTNGGTDADYSLVTILVGAVTFFAIVIAAVKGSENIKLIPFIIGIAAGYGIALAITLIGNGADIEGMKIMSFDSFKQAFDPITVQSFVKVPDFFFFKAIQEQGWKTLSLVDIGSIALIYVPIGVVELAQHIADHKNLGNIINKDLITDPGLDNTLLGDGVGSIVGSIFGGAANTTYGESIGCVAITGNASIVTIACASLGCMVLSFFTPFVALINSIPKCVMGGACVALYGFIAVSGLQMLRKVDLNNNKNLFIVSGILVTGIGGLTLQFGINELTGTPILTVTSLAVALLFGITTNLIVNDGKLVADASDLEKKAQQPEALAAKGVTPATPRKDRKKGRN